MGLVGTGAAVGKGVSDFTGGRAIYRPGGVPGHERRRPGASERERAPDAPTSGGPSPHSIQRLRRSAREPRPIVDLIRLACLPPCRHCLQVSDSASCPCIQLLIPTLCTCNPSSAFVMPPPPIQLFLTTIVMNPQIRQRQGMCVLDICWQACACNMFRFTAYPTYRVHLARATGEEGPIHLV